MQRQGEGMENNQIKNLNKIIQQIRIEQKYLLDRLEIGFINRPDEWRIIRSSILRSFGNDGLEGFVTQIIQGEMILQKNRIVNK
jgi:hypothetical protein